MAANAKKPTLFAIGLLGGGLLVQFVGHSLSATTPEPHKPQAQHSSKPHSETLSYMERLYLR